MTVLLSWRCMGTARKLPEKALQDLTPPGALITKAFRGRNGVIPIVINGQFLSIFQRKDCELAEPEGPKRGGEELARDCRTKLIIRTVYFYCFITGTPL